MALNMTPEQKEIGKANFRRVHDNLTRRSFIKSILVGGAVAPATAAAFFGYEYGKLHGHPVKAALIGAGDEGGVLVGEHNPSYLEFVACCDIRPSNQKRIFTGVANTIRKGFNHHYKQAGKKIKVFEDYKEMLADRSLGIEAVVIALPLHLHAPVAIDCMEAGKHVLCEKLMAWNIQQCKKMIEVSDRTDRILNVGHQRHYSLLYAQANEVLKAGVLGDVKHIRALWHRNNSWPRVDENGIDIPGSLRDTWRPPLDELDVKALQDEIQTRWDYKKMEELVRWRLYNRTGAGLMAELGSHQLDACSIFLGKVHPLAVAGFGGKTFYIEERADEREVDDHVFVTFEFPGPNYYYKDKNNKPTKDIKNKDDVVVVTYSSINTNAFEAYGECIMGTRGTMVVESEQSVQLYAERDPNLRDAGAPRTTAVTVGSTAAGQPVLDSSASSAPSVAAGGPASAATGGQAPAEISRGYREEMEHFAYCIRMHDQAGTTAEKERWRIQEPRCHGRIAMADAVIALTANQAMRRRERIVFQDGWFDAASSEVPDADRIPKNSKGETIRL